MYKTMSSVTPWNSTVQYGATVNNNGISPITLYQSLVSHNNILYLCDKGIVPTINVAPPLQPEAWTQIGIVSTQLSYANINSIGRSGNVLATGVLNLLNSRKVNSSDIGYDPSGNYITLPLNKTFNTVFNIGITTGGAATGNVVITGNNCSVSSNIVSLVVGATLLYTCSAVITTTSTASPNISFTLSNVSAGVNQITEGNFILNSVN